MKKRAVGQRGFTLIELLISIILMMILMSAVTLIFMRTTDTVNISEARTVVYMNARYALDTMENDLFGCISFNSGQQRFCMDNGYLVAPGALPTYGPGNHVGNAADRLIFRTTTTVADTLQTVEVEYSLIPGGMCLTPPGGTLPGSNVTVGDPSRNSTISSSSPPRPLMTLIRRVRTPNTTTPSTYDQPAKDKAGNIVQDEELCHYVISFNLEYYANNQQFSQLEPSYFTSTDPTWDPLGNGLGPNDTGATAYRVPFIRVTLVIVEDVGARQERAVQKTMWIPMG